MAKKHDQMQVLQSRVEDLETQLKRAVADYRNLEQRVTQSRSELSSWATGELIHKLLPVLDHLEKALAGAPEDEHQSSWFKGVEMSVKQLQQVLNGEGLEPITADPGSPPGTGSQFDPALHEAVDIKDGEENKILEVTRKGYKLGGRVLRPTQVVVGRNQQEEEAD